MSERGFAGFGAHSIAGASGGRCRGDDSGSIGAQAASKPTVQTTRMCTKTLSDPAMYVTTCWGAGVLGFVPFGRVEIILLVCWLTRRGVQSAFLREPTKCRTDVGGGMFRDR